MSEIIQHPVQVHTRNDRPPLVREEVVLRAYEVYCEVHRPQPAMINVKEGCRGGFGACELIAFLYARSFPKEEWTKRSDEAFKGMQGF